MKAIAIIFILLGLSVFGYWAASGRHFVTQYQIPVVKEVEDDFGDKVKTTTMKDEFRFGMMPDKGPDGALPIGGGLIGLGAMFLVVGVVRGKKNKQASPA